MPLLRRQVLFAQATGQPVFVALPHLDHPRAQVIADLAVTCLAIPQAMQGQSVTLRDGVAQLPDCAAFMIQLGDLVALTTEDLNKVIAARDLVPDAMIWRGATEDGKPGHPILFDAQLRPAFAGLCGDQGGAAILQAHQPHLVPLPGQRARLDLDTPEDWADWRRSQS